jgi:hypothetical protein
MDNTHNSIGLPNLTPKIEAMLAEIGITTKKEFLALGAKKIYILLIEADNKHSQVIRRRLLGAEQEIDWHIIAESEKRRAKSRFTDVDEP